MSTFSDWNGPQGSNVRAGDLVELVKAYDGVVRALNDHIGSAVDSSSAPHHTKTYVDNKVAELVADLNDYATKAQLSGYVTDADLSTAIGNFITSTDLADYTTDAELTNALGAYVAKADLASEISASDIIATILADVDAIKARYMHNNVTIPGTLQANTLQAPIVSTGRIGMTDKTFNAQPTAIAGDANKYFILAQLYRRSGTIYLSYTNTTPFAATIHFAQSAGDTENTAGLNITCDVDLEALGINFSVLSGTTATGTNGKQYLAISCEDWNNLNSLAFTGSVINALLPSNTGYETPNGCTHSSFTIDFGLTSRLAAVEADVAALEAISHVPVGGVVGWDDMDNIPTGWEAHPDVDFHIRRTV